MTSTAFGVIKVIFAVGFLVAGTVAIWLAPAMAMPLMVGSIAWSQIQV
jgi:hypothetical protein